MQIWSSGSYVTEFARESRSYVRRDLESPTSSGATHFNVGGTSDVRLD